MRGGGLWRAGHGEQGWAAGGRGGGSAPTALGGGGRVVEHRWEVGELVDESIWVEEGRRQWQRRRRSGRRAGLRLGFSWEPEGEREGARLLHEVKGPGARWGEGAG